MLSFAKAILVTPLLYLLLAIATVVVAVAFLLNPKKTRDDLTRMS